jgi:3-hydroxyacyl-CoA dehydrogenase/enoyl-CoA hydratase/3-hydroxybutyryl-CoA epimerase
MGAAAFVALCDRLTEKYGARFAPPQLLREMAAKGESFYGRYSAHQHAA